MITLEKISKIYPACMDFPLKAPENFIAKIEPDDLSDPLLLQILPDPREQNNVLGFNTDPLMEKKYSPVPGLIHKYYGRVLLLVTDNCAINCRFCFRRYSHNKISDWQKVFLYIKNDSNITEVILSGGDPLILKSEKLKEIMDHLANIPHVKRIRIHSRMPIVMPELVTAKLLQSKLPIVLMVHCNHPNEIDKKVIKSIGLLRRKNIFIFNQSVLLRKINDQSSILVTLSEKLFDAGIVPCYLHLLDKVKGAAHFHVGIAEAKRIYFEMKKKLPGYLVPKLVMEVGSRKKHV